MVKLASQERGPAMFSCKKDMGCLALVLIVALCCGANPANATGASKYPTFDAEVKIVILGEPELGKPFWVEFIFKPLVDCYHSRGIPDAAYLSSVKGVKFLSGDTSWTGFLEKGIQHTLRAQYVVDSPIFVRLRGRLVAMEVLETIPLANINWKGQKKVGAKCIVGQRSRRIDFRPDDEKQHQQTIPRLLMTDSGLVSMGYTRAPPPTELEIRYPKVAVVARERPSSKGTSRTPEYRKQQQLRKADLPIRLDSSVQDTIQITYYQAKPYVFVTDKSITRVSLKLVSGKGRYDEIDSKRGVFYLESDSAVFKVSAGELEIVLIIMKAQVLLDRWRESIQRHK